MRTHRSKSIAPFYHTASLTAGDSVFGDKKHGPGNPNNSFVGATARAFGQKVSHRGDVFPNYGVITVRKEDHVRARITVLAPCHRIADQAPDEHGLNVRIRTYLVKPSLVYALRMAQGRSEIISARAIRLLAEKRESLGLSMKVVADRAGVSHTTVGRIERGEINPTLDMLLRIAGAIQVDLWPFLEAAESAFPAAKDTKSIQARPGSGSG